MKVLLVFLLASSSFATTPCEEPGACLTPAKDAETHIPPVIRYEPVEASSCTICGKTADWR